MLFGFVSYFEFRIYLFISFLLGSGYTSLGISIFLQRRMQCVSTFDFFNSYSFFIVKSRRGAGAVERDGLENRFPRLRNVGSNPTLSAIKNGKCGNVLLQVVMKGD